MASSSATLQLRPILGATTHSFRHSGLRGKISSRITCPLHSTCDSVLLSWALLQNRFNWVLADLLVRAEADNGFLLISNTLQISAKPANHICWMRQGRRHQSWSRSWSSISAKLNLKSLLCLPYRNPRRPHTCRVELKNDSTHPSARLLVKRPDRPRRRADGGAAEIPTGRCQVHSIGQCRHVNLLAPTSLVLVVKLIKALKSRRVRFVLFGPMAHDAFGQSRVERCKQHSTVYAKLYIWRTACASQVPSWSQW